MSGQAIAQRTPRAIHDDPRASAAHPSAPTGTKAAQ